jgi:dTMP kinase
MFMSFEGTEGVGKTTLIKRMAAYLEQQGHAVLLTREPGGTPLAEQIRGLLLNPSEEAMTENCELLLIFAARAQHIAQVIQPAIKAQQWVLSDRFVDASFAYQGGGRGLNQQSIALLQQQFVEVMPQITFWLDAPVEVGMQRAQKRGELDRFEQEKQVFFQRVREVYAQRAQAEPQRFIRLDATQTPEHLFEQAIEALKQHI